MAPIDFRIFLWCCFAILCNLVYADDSSLEGELWESFGGDVFSESVGGPLNWPSERIAKDSFKQNDEKNLVLFKGKCLRYCIEQEEDNKLRHMILFWSASYAGLSDHARIITSNKISDSFEACQIYLNVDCDVDEDSDPKFKNLNIDSGITTTLLEKNQLIGDSLSTFLIDNSMEEIIIHVTGAISTVLIKIPMGEKIAIPSEISMSLRRNDDTGGLRVRITGAPPGGWSIKLSGLENSRYNLNIKSILMETRYSDRYELLSSGNQGSRLSALSNYELHNNKRKILSQRSAEKLIVEAEDRTDRRIMQELPTNPERLSENLIGVDNSNATSAIVMEKIQEIQEIQGRSSIGSAEDFAEVYFNKTHDNPTLRMNQVTGSEELSKEIARYSNEDTVDKKKMLIEVNRNTNLIVEPGRIHRVVFDVWNLCVLLVRYTFQVKSNPFRVNNVQPAYIWLYPGQTTQVAVDVIVPANIATDTVNTLSLSIPGTEIKEKSVYLYVRGSDSRIRDNSQPSIEYSFNNNCAQKLSRNECNKSRWSVDITVHDYDSGLKRVISTPNSIYPRTEFISGTKDKVTFYYTATCCDTTATITAVDLFNNYYSRSIDVTAWNNLSTAEIAAIAVGVLLILLLIVLLVLAIVYCFQRKKSHDLPYTQRYGTRATPQPDGTNF